MEIHIKQKHKSINPPCDFELPKFTILTGKNGSGKTHLLEAISTKEKSEIKIEGRVVQGIKYIQFNGLNPNIQEACDPNSIYQYIKKVWSQYNSANKNPVRADRKNKVSIIGTIADANARRFIEKVFKDSKKPFDKLTEDDFADNFDITFMSADDFFTAQFALIFKNYHRCREENNFNGYCQTKNLPVTRPVLTKEEFSKKFGDPPWEFLNGILKEMNIPYEVNSPEGTRIDSNFIFKLKDLKEGFEISSADLSTGEKVLMSLALAIYNSGEDFGKPDMLLIDEPDAGLHPSMAKTMIDILKKNIVKENDIPVIIATHSPTTVIASEGISIYQLERGSNIPSKISAQAAVELLSSDIPFLKISTDKRRQVFVES